MKHKILLSSSVALIIMIIVITNITNAQVAQDWVQRYNGPGSGTDQSNSIAVDFSGNVFVTGSSPSAGLGTEDYATIKYDSSGVQQWVARYNGTGSSVDKAYDIAIDDTGYIYVTGGSNGTGSGFDFLTIKYSTTGDTIWTQRYNGPRNAKDIAYSIVLDDSGNVYVTGESEGSTGTHGIFEDYATIKYNSDGVRKWVARYNGPAGDYDKANSVDVDEFGNVYVTGVSDGGSSGSGDPHFDYATIKYNNAGIVDWIRRHNGSDNALDEAKSIKVDLFGNVVVTGGSKNFGSSDDYLTIKYSSIGDTLWISKYNGTGNNTDIANSLVVDEIGNSFVTGKSYGGSTNDYDIVTIKYDTSGDSVWVKRYNGDASGIDEGVAVALDISGNVYVAGYSSGITTAFDYTTIKYSDSGAEDWIIKYTNSDAAGSSEEVFKIFVDSMSNVYVTGMSALDFATVKYVHTSTSVDNSSQNIPDLSLEQNYPNPFNPATTIQFQIPNSSFVNLKVYDVLGNEIAVLVNEEKLAGNYEVIFDASQLSSGIYFYKLQTESFVGTKKMILIK